MDFGWLNSEIGWKIANGQLLAISSTTYTHRCKMINMLVHTENFAVLLYEILL